MADEKIKIDIEVNGTGNIAEEINQVTEASRSLKAQLREAQLELQKLSDTPGVDVEQLQQAAQRVGELKDAIGDANDMANNFAGNSFENMSSSLGGVKDAIMNLDFGKANDMAKNFAANAKNISFGGAVSSLKDLGSTFMTLGKSLLTNPLFLIGTVIALLVVAIVKVLDKLGVLKKITEMVGAAFDLLMKGIEAVVTAITDFLGITSEAEREATAAMERSAAAAEAGALKTKNANEELIQTLDMKISIAKAEGKQTVQLEREKLQAIRETAKAEWTAAMEKFKLAVKKGEADAKEIADLKEKARLARLAYADSKNDLKVFEAETLAEKKKANQKKQEEDDKAAKTAATNAASARKAALEKQKEYQALRLSTSRQLEDLRAILMADGINKELAMNDVKYKRLIEDTLKNEKLLQSEKQALISTYRKLQQKEEDKIFDEQDKKDKELVDKKKADQEKALADAKAGDEAAWNQEKAAMDLKTSYIADEQQKAISERQNTYAQELVDLQNALDNKTITQDEYDQLTIAAEKKKNKDLDDINEEYAQKEKERRKSIADAALNVTSQSLGAIANLVGAFAGKSEAQQKKAFKIQKGIQIAQATIDTFKAATGAYSSLASIPVVGPALGAVAAAAAIAAGIANIRKIEQTEFKPEGGGSTPTDTGGGGGGAGAGLGGGGATTAPTPPSISLFGQAMTGSEGQGQQQIGMRQSVMRAYVVESEITGTQNRLQNYQQRAEIG